MDNREIVESVEDIDPEQAQAIESRERFENLVSSSNNPWAHSAVGVEAKRAAMTMLSTKTGMYARIPLVCKADDCPYSDSCPLLPYNLAPVGEFCPIEVAQIELRYIGYDKDFNLDESSFTDRCIVSEIINCDIMMERCKALMAKEGVPVIDVVTGISERGEEYSHPEVSKYFEAYDKAARRRTEYYQLMMATRKDNKKDTEEHESLAKILAQVANGNGFIVEQRPGTIIEVEPEE